MSEFAHLLAPLIGESRGPMLERSMFVICNAVFSLTHRGVLPKPTALSDEDLKQEILDLILPYLEAKARAPSE